MTLLSHFSIPLIYSQTSNQVSFARRLCYYDEEGEKKKRKRETDLEHLQLPNEGAWVAQCVKHLT